MNSELKDKNKEKEKKFKPMKVPTKAQFASSIPSYRKEESQSSKVTDNKQNKIKPKASGEDKKGKTHEGITTELLREGFIQSFIDMFYISHRCLPNVMNNNNYFGEIISCEGVQEMAEADYAFLSDLGGNLKKAELHCYYNNTEKESAMNEYNSLAYVYEEQGDYVTSAYFYDKVIQLAESSGNKQYEVVAMVGLGKCFDQAQRTDRAIEIFEQSLELARDVDSESDKNHLIKTISKDLIEIYLKVAEQCEKQEMGEKDALKYYEKCLEVAKKSGEKESEGRICYKIGELYYRSEEFKKSVKYQEQYLDIIKQQLEESKKITDESKEKAETNMKTKTMEAHASLAKCYLKMKEVELTEDHLNHYNQLAKQLKIQNAQADSSYYLAKLHEQKGNSHQAIEFYKAYFQAAKSQRPQKKDRQLVDRARVTYAIAKANENMDRFIGLFKGSNSLKDVLDWKIKKELK